MYYIYSIYFQAHGGFEIIPFLLSSVRLLQKISRLAKLPTGGAQRGACAKNFRFLSDHQLEKTIDCDGGEKLCLQ